MTAADTGTIKKPVVLGETKNPVNFSLRRERQHRQEKYEKEEIK